ncbi:hypothetical protein Patl1_19625 [Pistacia atlantica]|uniref:Uncharacterized protein n=1 Tax=Pistacia atlantica TaxID=434234 RepID=A0ACC1C2D1_9ROSI|nr:hypothetical protein Patl1_19625 [Pistacia atlantica]
MKAMREVQAFALSLKS